MVSSCFIFEWSSVPPAAAETHPRDASFGPSIRPENVSRLEWEDHLNGIWIRRNIHIYHHISSYIQNDPNISINHQVWNFCQACLRLWLRKALLSMTLSGDNVYCDLVDGKFFQGRGKDTPAYRSGLRFFISNHLGYTSSKWPLI